MNPNVGAALTAAVSLASGPGAGRLARPRPPRPPRPPAGGAAGAVARAGADSAVSSGARSVSVGQLNSVIVSGASGATPITVARRLSAGASAAVAPTTASSARTTAANP